MYHSIHLFCYESYAFRTGRAFYKDNGIHFVGARKELDNMFDAMTHQTQGWLDNDRSLTTTFHKAVHALGASEKP
jgi:hypothetical protein